MPPRLRARFGRTTEPCESRLAAPLPVRVTRPPKLPAEKVSRPLAVKLMTFETARVADKTESETLLNSKLQLTQVTAAVIAVVGVAQYVTLATSSIECWILK